MDRNTIIAFILIAIIFILWQFFWIKTTPQRPQPQTVTDTIPVDTSIHRQAALPAIAKKGQTLDTLSIASDSIPEKFVQVETEFYSAKLSTRGGGLVSLQLKRYKHADSNDVNLIPEGWIPGPRSSRPAF